MTHTQDTQSTPAFYAIIPAHVRYCEKLEMGARLLYGEITALCSREGYCWASNKYFADLYKVEDRTIRLWIESLKNNNFIKVEIERSGFQVTRKIWISLEIQNIFASGKNLPDVRKISSGRPEKNDRYINTENNTKSNTTASPTPSEPPKLDESPPDSESSLAFDKNLLNEFRKTLKEEGQAERAVKYYLENQEELKKKATKGNPIGLCITLIKKNVDLKLVEGREMIEKRKKWAMAHECEDKGKMRWFYALRDKIERGIGNKVEEIRYDAYHPLWETAGLT